MKTNLFMALAFAFLMLFAACTEERIIYVEKENGIEVLPGEGVIKISLSNDLQTKAARPIGSSEAANNVNRIKFSFISGDLEVSSGVEIEGAYDSRGEKLSGFGVAATDSSILILPDNNTEKEFSVKFKSLPDPGSYAIIAYGYNCVEGNDDFPYTRTIATDNSPRYFKCSGISTGGVEEIFAGYCIRKNASSDEENRFIRINQYKMFSEEVSVTITRQVAGLMAYLCNVPASIDNQSVDKITISTPAKMNGFIFPASIKKEGEDYNGISESTVDVDLLTFIIKDNNDGSDSNGYYKFNNSKKEGKRFLLAEGMNANEFEDLMCKDNTLFGSCFLLPYDAAKYFSTVNEYKDRTTLYLTYYTKVDGSNYTKIKSVRLKNSNQGYPELDYDIRCNHFYSVGGKTDVETTTDDDPLDISDETGYVDVFLTINDEWDNTLNLIK